MTPNIAASVRARLLNVAKTTGEEFERTLVRFASERWLYRLGQSAVRDRCILKGAALLAVWLPNPHRATRDVDLLGSGASDEDALAKLVSSVCETPCPEDGVTFDIGELSVEPIREEAHYAGMRALFWARLANAKVRMQVDFGFGDAIAHGPELVTLPLMLDALPTTTLRAYPREQSVAEKFEAMVQLEARNSRMKDFHDVWVLAGAFTFEGERLSDAVAECFARRKTAWTDEMPAALTAKFYEDATMRARWASYVKAGVAQDAPPPNFASIGERLISFLGPVRDAVMAGEPMPGRWMPTGEWLKVTGDES